MSRNRKTGAARRPGRPKKGGRDTRESILAVARRAFAKQGIAAVGLRALAGEVGITPASLLHHAGSRQALVEAVLRGVGEDLARRLKGTRDHVDLLARLARWADEDPAAARLALQAMLAAPSSALVEEDEARRREKAAEDNASFRQAMMPLWPAFEVWRQVGAKSDKPAALSELVMAIGALLFEAAARDTLARMSGLTPARMHERFLRDLMAHLQGAE
ncbi:MAG: TetR/AcrR family transcriptional regulator [Alphaproteobacteria bacterium]|nr:MAG: TetR/AcrR family transcriptional regulator [Alphaproteobacteria bacterium]